MLEISLIIRITNKIWRKFNVNSVLFCIPDFNLLGCKLDNFTFLNVILSYFILTLH